MSRTGTAPRWPRVVALAAAATLVASGCRDDGRDASPATTPGSTTTTTAPAPTAETIVFNGQGNDLVAYSSAPPFGRQVVIRNATDDPEHGLDMNGQICFDPRDPRRFVAGEDTGQPNPPAGWGIFELDGDRVGELSARQVGKLTPTYQPGDDDPENYGCGFLDDGRIVTVDVGDQATGTGTGQLVVWFPPFDSRDVRYCKLDVTLPTGQGVLVDGDAVYVAAARAGVLRYDATTFPTSDDAAGGCGGRDVTGAPMAEGVERTLFVEPGKGNPLATPSGIAKGPDGLLYVSSVFNGVIAELDADGRFRRTVLEPPAGEVLGEEPFSTGTPLGLGVGPDGTIYYADIGIVIRDDGVGPGSRTGTVRRITFDQAGEPQPPEVVDRGLAFPDGIGLWSPEPEATATTPTTTEPEGTASAVARGRPYRVERVTETFVDRSRPTDDPLDRLDAPDRTLTVDLYVPDGDGPFPLLVLAHGNDGARSKFTQLARAWAEAGYVVAVPDFPLTRSGLPDGPRLADVANQPGDVSFVVTSMLRRSAGSDAPLGGRIDGDEVGVAGLSLGGATVYGVTFNSCCRDDRIDAAVVMSGVLLAFDGDFDLSGTPLLVLHGDADAIVPLDVGHDAYEQARAPRYFATLRGGQHSPPYEDTPSPHDEAVVALTTEFWDAYLYDDRDALDRLADYETGSAPLAVEGEP